MSPPLHFLILFIRRVFNLLTEMMHLSARYLVAGRELPSSHCALQNVGIERSIFHSRAGIRHMSCLQLHWVEG